MWPLVKRIGFLFRTLIPALYSAYFYQNYKALVDALTNTGALWIKIGQWLSTRNDILPRELCDALDNLQEEVAFHSPEYSEDILERSFDASEMIKSFKKKPYIK